MQELLRTYVVLHGLIQGDAGIVNRTCHDLADLFVGANAAVEYFHEAMGVDQVDVERRQTDDAARILGGFTLRKFSILFPRFNGHLHGKLANLSPVFEYATAPRAHGGDSAGEQSADCGGDDASEEGIEHEGQLLMRVTVVSAIVGFLVAFSAPSLWHVLGSIAGGTYQAYVTLRRSEKTFVRYRVSDDEIIPGRVLDIGGPTPDRCDRRNKR